MKWCNGCQQTKEAGSFYTDRRKSTGLTSRCKTCTKAAQSTPAAKAAAKRRRNDPETRTYHTVRAAHKNPQRKERNRGYFLRSTYGITLEEENRMWEAQDGLCAVCALPMSREGRTGPRAHIDHNHETGRVRGLLCSNCNRGLGCFRDSIENLTNAIAYLERTHHGRGPHR